MLVTMHVPIFNEVDLNLVRPNMEYLKEIFEKSGNVKYVLSGHFHVIDKTIEINGVKYIIIPSISWVNHEGSYKALDLE